MNTPSPLVPQGAFQDKGKSHVRITVFAILAVHVVLLGVLLIAGCNKKSATETADSVPPVPAAPATDQWPTSPGGSPQTNDAVIPPVPPPIPNNFATTSPPAGELPAPGIVTPPPGGVTPPPPGNLTENPVPSAGVREHTIAKGETLGSIGKKYGVGYKAIEAANPGINATRLKIGDKIKIPEKAATAPAAATAAPADPSGATIYVVKSGDNLLKISKTTGVPVKQLRAANRLKTDQIRVGQKLKIPARSTAPSVDTSVPPVPPPGNP